MSDDGATNPPSPDKKSNKKLPGGPLASRKVAAPVGGPRADGPGFKRGGGPGFGPRGGGQGGPRSGPGHGPPRSGPPRNGPNSPTVGEFTRKFAGAFKNGPRRGFDGANATASSGGGAGSEGTGGGYARKPFGPPRGGPRDGPGRGGPGRGGPGRDGAAMLGQGVKLVYQDGDVLVLEKPAGILTAGQKNEVRETLFDRVKGFVRSTSRPVLRRELKQAKEQGLPRHAAQGVWVVHRLDKEASGLLVFATSVRAFEVLKNDFKAKRVHRIYTALVEGEAGPVGHNGTVQSFLKEDEEGNVRSLSSDEFRGSDDPESSNGGDSAKLAVTHFKVIAVGNGMSLLQVRLETGRKNQIRVHMASKGLPLVGDLRYGAKLDPGRRLCLHASELGFNHPGSGVSVRYSSPAPEAFYEAVGAKQPTPPIRNNPVAGPAPYAPVVKPTVKDTSWQQVAEWYDDLISERTNDHYEMVILPGVLRLSQPLAEQRVLDVACGQGMIAARLAELGASVVGIDASRGLIEAAQSRSAGVDEARLKFLVGDAMNLAQAGIAPSEFDLAVCVMGLTNLDPLSPLFEGVSTALKKGGRFVAILQHPAFRTPDQSSWGWDDQRRTQYRRVDGYLSNGFKAITMNPGAVAKGEKAITTMTFHRPVQAYVKQLAECGFMIDALEEWPAQRVSTSGPRAVEENRSRAEIPLFLAIRAVKTA